MGVHMYIKEIIDMIYVADENDIECPGQIAIETPRQIKATKHKSVSEKQNEIENGLVWNLRPAA